MKVAKSAMLLHVRTAWIVLLVIAVSGCSPVYQLSQDEDGNEAGRMRREVPALHGAFFDVVGSVFGFNHRGKIDKERILNEALRESGAPRLDELTLANFSDCSSWKPKSSTADVAARNPLPEGCYATNSDAAPAISHPIAAMIRAAALECVFWTFRENSTAINQTTIANALGLAAVGAAILKATGSSQTAAVAAGAAGVASLGANLQSGAPKIVASTAKAVITEGFNYYPFLQLRIQWWNGPDRDKAFFASVLIEMWDVAGSACPAGVLKGASWFNGYEELR